MRPTSTVEPPGGTVRDNTIGRKSCSTIDSLNRGYTRSRDLLDKIKKEVNSEVTALSWASLLESRSNDYAAILTPSHDAWSTYHQEVRADLDTLRYLGISQIRPLLMSAFGKFSDKELARLIKNEVN